MFAKAAYCDMKLTFRNEKAYLSGVYIPGVMAHRAAYVGLHLQRTTLCFLFLHQ